MNGSDLNIESVASASQLICLPKGGGKERFDGHWRYEIHFVSPHFLRFQDVMHKLLHHLAGLLPKLFLFLLLFCKKEVTFVCCKYVSVLFFLLLSSFLKAFLLEPVWYANFLLFFVFAPT